MNTRSLEDELFYIGIVTFGILLIGGILFYWLILPHITFPGCVVYKLFGLYCPGCGGTRAFIALLRGQFVKSFLYHPLVIYGAGLYIAFMGTHLLARIFPRLLKKGMLFRNWYLYFAVVLLFGNWIIKNVLLIFYHIEM